MKTPVLSKASRRNLKESLGCQGISGITEMTPSPCWVAIATNSSNSQAQPITSTGPDRLRQRAGCTSSPEHSSLYSQSGLVGQTLTRHSEQTPAPLVSQTRPFPFLGPPPSDIRREGQPTSSPRNSFSPNSYSDVGSSSRVPCHIRVPKAGPESLAQTGQDIWLGSQQAFSKYL